MLHLSCNLPKTLFTFAALPLVMALTACGGSDSGADEGSTFLLSGSVLEEGVSGSGIVLELVETGQTRLLDDDGEFEFRFENIGDAVTLLTKAPGAPVADSLLELVDLTGTRGDEGEYKAVIRTNSDGYELLKFRYRLFLDGDVIQCGHLTRADVVGDPDYLCKED